MNKLAIVITVFLANIYLTCSYFGEPQIRVLTEITKYWLLVLGQQRNQKLVFLYDFTDLHSYNMWEGVQRDTLQLVISIFSFFSYKTRHMGYLILFLNYMPFYPLKYLVLMFNLLHSVSHFGGFLPFLKITFLFIEIIMWGLYITVYYFLKAKNTGKPNFSINNCFWVIRNFEK